MINYPIEKLHKKMIIGRSEWCSLPDLNLPYVKAKVDTGAQTSALHAINIEPYVENTIEMVAFDVQPLQDDDDLIVRCHAPVVDKRYIMSSNGHKERRFIIYTLLRMNGHEPWEIEVSLSDRDPLRFRMLLGRQALKSHILVHPGISCHLGGPSNEEAHKYYESER